MARLDSYLITEGLIMRLLRSIFYSYHIEQMANLLWQKRRDLVDSQGFQLDILLVKKIFSRKATWVIL